MTTIPEDNLYTREHEWVRIEGNKAEVGITEHAQKSLGDIVYVELPEIEDEIGKTKIIENRDNYCNFCSPEGRDPKPIEALNEWRRRRPEQPMMGGKRKTHRRNKIKRRKKTKRQRRRKRRSRKKKGGYGPARVFTTKSDEALFNARFPNWGDEDIYVSLLKNSRRGRSRKIGEGIIVSKNQNVITLTDDSPYNAFGVKDYPWSSFDRIIVHRGRGRGSLNTFDGA